MAPTTERIWKEHADQLRGFIYRRIPDSSVVDDLVQEVFVKVQSKVDTLQDETRLQGWLYQITRNVIVDHFRGLSSGKFLNFSATLQAKEKRVNGNVEIHSDQIELLDVQ